MKLQAMLFVNFHDSSMVENENLSKKKLSIELVHHLNIMSLRIYTFLLVVFTSFGCYEVFSAEPGKSYDTYTKEAESFCDDGSKSWSTNNTLVPKIDYPELSSKSVNATLAKWRDNNPRWMVGDEKARLRADLDPNNIGEFT